jgi:hypothetical protein
MALPILICSAQGVGNSTPAVACQGELTFTFSGVAGGTTQLQVSPDDGATWINYGAALSADGVLVANIPTGAQVRVSVATAGSVTCRAGMWDVH